MPRTHKPGPDIGQKIQSLRSTIIDRPPFCSGTVPVASSDLLLFYGKPTAEDVDGGAFARRLDLTKASEAELKQLTDICDTATFGLNHEDVLDLSYRNAWKLDPAYFASKLNILHAGLMESIRYNLLQGNQGNMTFFAELYKLNVYGKGSFFKPHKDTPRGDKMFGSLVVILPTAHEGGTLTLRHNSKEWKFDSKTETPSSITYVAFYGDVEHEVAEVTTGYRLTLTYNLYFGNSLDSQAVVSTPSSTSAALFTSLPSNAASFQNTLSELLADKTFLPDGGLLGFGLSHEYPLAATGSSDDNELVRIAELLKGNDAAIMQACRALGLRCSLDVGYRDGGDYDERIMALCGFVPNFEGEYIEGDFISELKGLRGVILVNSEVEEGDEEEIVLDKYDDIPNLHAFVHWVTKQTSHNMIESHHVAYGNEPSLEYDYGRICLIVNVGRPESRGKAV